MAQEVCDRVGILFRGKLVALDTVDELMNKQTSAIKRKYF